MKFLTYIRWFFVIVGLGLFGIATTPYSLPLILFLVFTKGMNLFLWIWLFLSAFALLLALILKNVRFNPFWWWLDDSRFSSIRESGYSEDYEIHLKGKKETLWTAYGWHLRNRVWNLDSLFKPKKQIILKGNQNIKVVEFIYDNLHKFDVESTRIKQDGIYEAFAGLKYWKGGVSTWNTNNGNMISIEKSIIGKGFIWYKAGKWFGFRYSECKMVNYGFWKGWRTLKFGTNSKRFLFSIKFQKDKLWQ